MRTSKSQLEELNQMTLNNTIVSLWFLAASVSAFIATAFGLL